VTGLEDDLSVVDASRKEVLAAATAATCVRDAAVVGAVAAGRCDFALVAEAAVHRRGRSVDSSRRRRFVANYRVFAPDDVV